MRIYLQLQPQCTCVCYSPDVHKDICKMYNKVGYDFTNFVVTRCLQHVSKSANEDQYIFASCDKRLKETSNENPVLPYYGKYPNAEQEQTFRKHLIKDLNMCAHAVTVCYFVKLCDCLTLQTMILGMRL